MPHKHAIFDFCETLVALQTADRFVRFVLWRSGRYHGYIIYFFLKLISRQFKVRKTTYLGLLRGLRQQVLEQAAKEFAVALSQHEITKVVNELKRRREQGYYVIVVSGGYDCYLRYFKSDLIDATYGTEIEVREGRVTGGLVGEDCIGRNKVKKLAVNDVLANIDYESSVVFSDCISDLPLFELAKENVLVRSKAKPSTWRDWKGEELLWSNE